jgi:hypothetical protein
MAPSKMNLSAVLLVVILLLPVVMAARGMHAATFDHELHTCCNWQCRHWINLLLKVV